MAKAHTVDELTEELHAIGNEIDGWKETYGVNSLAELRQSIGRHSLKGYERRNHLEIIDEWRYNIEMREWIRFAISLQSSLTTLGAEPF